MNNDASIGKFLVALAEAFPGEVPSKRIKIYMEVLKEDLERADLRQLFKSLISKHEFFPTIKAILDETAPQETPRQIAEEFVDTMIAIFQSPGNAYETAGSDNYNLWKKHIGFTKFDFQNGNVDPRFQKSSWIDRMERVFNGDKASPRLHTMGELIQLRESDENPKEPA